MRKVLFILAFVFFQFTTFAQLKVIDQIVGTLIPSISKEIKDILSTSNKKGKIDSSEVGKLKTEFKGQINDLYQTMLKDQNDIDVLNKLFSKTSTLLGPISSMKSFANLEFIRALENVSDQTLCLETIRQFQSYWSQFGDKIADLSRDQNVGDNASLQTTLNLFSTQVNSNLLYLQNDITFLGKVTGGSSLPELKTYIKSLNSSSVRDHIDAIIVQINTLNQSLIAHISSFSTSLKNGQTKISNSL